MGALITIFTTAACGATGYALGDELGGLIGAGAGVAIGIGIDMALMNMAAHTPTHNSQPKAP